MQVPTELTIETCLRKLAYDENWERLKREFLDFDHTHEEAFLFAAWDLNGAYLSWMQGRDAVTALTHLENARAICEERLASEYLQKYNAAVSYFKGMLSRCSTPVHAQNADIGEMHVLLQCLWNLTILHDSPV